MRQGCRDIVIFDLGGVLIDWNPRHLYRKLFAGDEAAMEAFLETVCTHDGNRCQDWGAALPTGEAERRGVVSVALGACRASAQC